MSSELTPAHGGSQWYQWDYGQKITILDDDIDQVHIYNPDREEATVIDVVDGVAEIPDRYLQEAGQLKVYAFTTAEGRTTGVDTWKILGRQKPEDYPYVPDEDISAGIAIGSPLTARTAAEMKNKSRVYVYTGAESGYTNGNWYYWDGTEWTSGGIYNAVAFTTDDTLTQAGEAADAAKVGSELSNLQSDIHGGEKSLTLEKGSFRFSGNAIVWQGGTIRCRTPQNTCLRLSVGDTISTSNNVVFLGSRVDENFNRLENISIEWLTSFEISTPGRYILLLQNSDATTDLTAETAMQNCVLTSTGVQNVLADMMIEEGAVYG